MNSIEEIFGSLVYIQRKQLGITQCELARSVGCSQANICKIEDGRLRVRADIAFRLAKALRIKPKELSDLFTGGVL